MRALGLGIKDLPLHLNGTLGILDIVTPRNGTWSIFPVWWQHFCGDRIVRSRDQLFIQSGLSIQVT